MTDHFTPISSSHASPPSVHIQLLYLVLNTVINLYNYQFLCFVLFQVFFQVYCLLYHHPVHPLRFQLLRPSQHPSEIQHNRHLTNLLGSRFFYQVQIPSGNHQRSLVQFPLCLNALSQVEHQVVFLLNNQVECLTCPLL